MDADDITYLRKREAEERAAAKETARMTHEYIADEYADRADALAQASAATDARLSALIDRID